MITETQWALVQMLDGVKKHDLPDQIGCSEQEANRIWTAYEDAKLRLLRYSEPPGLIKHGTPATISPVAEVRNAQQEAAEELMYLRMELKRNGLDYPAANPALSRAIQSIADAERMRWLLNGNGYFMEEEGLCGVHPCSEYEMNEARKIIDQEMLETSRVHCTAHVDYKPRGDA